jgi:cell division protein ZapB
MDADLKTLEDSLVRFIELNQRLKTENHHLRQELAVAQSDARQLKENMLTASEKLQSIMQSLPEETA